MLLLGVAFRSGPTALGVARRAEEVKDRTAGREGWRAGRAGRTLTYRQEVIASGSLTTRLRSSAQGRGARPPRGRPRSAWGASTVAAPAARDGGACSFTQIRGYLIAIAGRGEKIRRSGEGVELLPALWAAGQMALQLGAIPGLQPAEHIAAEVDVRIVRHRRSVSPALPFA